MKRVIIIMGLLSLLMGCTKSSEYITVIDAKKAKEMMETEEVIILDVRTSDEFKEGHIKNALNLDVYSIGSDEISILPDKNATILIYCRSGNRSHQAAVKLEKLGYTKLYDFGGIINWPYEIVK